VTDETANCLNCDSPLAGSQRFCGACGQRTTPVRLTMGQIAHDFLHALTHVDHSIIALIKDLALRPGKIAREYVDGRRKKHFGPLAFLVLTVGIASFMIAITGVQFFRIIGDDTAAGVLQRHVNIVILLQMPLLAAICALLFWNERLHYAEHMVLTAYTSGFRILLLGLVATPLIHFARIEPTTEPFVPFYYGLWLMYFAFAAAQFYRGRTWWIVVRALMAVVGGQLATAYVIYGFIVLFATFRAH
jgi:hypothetical protein